MRIFVTSTPEELEAYQQIAGDVAAELGFEVVLRNPALGRRMTPVAACARQVADADAVLVLVGHRRGRVPPPEAGGDGRHPWVWWETHAAFEHGKRVVPFLADEGWRPELREDDPRAAAILRDFRGELARLGTLFDDDRESFRRRLRQRLGEPSHPSGSFDAVETDLRRWPPPELPERPYPVLLPYTHPDLLAGRGRELADLRRLLAKPVPILGLHAASGVGKSSLLAGGLVPALRAEGRPVAFGHHPAEPGIAGRLLGELVEGEVYLTDDNPYAFVDYLGAVRRAAGEPPVLVLDQFEELLRRRSGAPDEASRYRDSLGGLGPRAAVGMLLAASVQRLPGLSGPPCRWLLAYRQEFHGDVYQWLREVLRDARAETSLVLFKGVTQSAAESLPHDLTSPERFHTYALPPLGTPAPGARDVSAAAARAFEAAIARPLELRGGDGEKLYPWRFRGDGAARLAAAFGRAREARPEAPLAPELQVVLAHLLEQARRRAGGAHHDGHGDHLVEVGDDSGELIDQALEQHLRRSLDIAFPGGKQARVGRTRALLVLRELADARGRRERGRPVEVLAQAIGPEGHEVLEKLATPRTRLVLLKWQAGEQVYVLSHDRMAEILVRLFDDGSFAGLGVDAELLALRRYVALQSALFASGEVEQASDIPSTHARRIKRHGEALLWGEERRLWWQACKKRHRADRKRRAVRSAVAALLVAAVAAAAWVWADRRAQYRALLQQVVDGDPETAFAALAELTARGDDEAALAEARRRKSPFDVLERGLGGVAEDRGRALLRVAELLLPLVEEKPRNTVRIAATVWALDFFALGDPALGRQAMALRNRVLSPLRRIRPPPPLPVAGDPRWADIPAGTFRMGSGAGEGRDAENMADERPRHPVTLSAFRIQVHEVTFAEYRLLVPDFEGEDELPVNEVFWDEAYTYAAWLGGRLPTEAEWEYAARAGCPHTFCGRDGNEALVGQVAWWLGNSVADGATEPSLQRPGQLAANPWGLFDVYGNVGEWTADWYAAYSDEPAVDPSGPTSSAEDLRTFRGGHAWEPEEWVVPSGRGGNPSDSGTHIGFRVALPAAFTETEDVP